MPILDTSGIVRIYVATEPQDMSKSFSGLAGAVEKVLGKDPQSGTLFVFLNRRRNLLKILSWDKNGFCLLCKRLSAGTFTVPDSTTGKPCRSHCQCSIKFSQNTACRCSARARFICRWACRVFQAWIEKNSQSGQFVLLSRLKACSIKSATCRAMRKPGFQPTSNSSMNFASAMPAQEQDYEVIHLVLEMLLTMSRENNALQMRLQKLLKDRFG